MKHIVVDLEMNMIRPKSEARRICTMETIEIGAVMLDDNHREISCFRTYVKPEYNDGIVPKITRLTGISDAMVVNAPEFKEALGMFSDWCLGPGDEVTLYAWSNADYQQLVKEMKLKDYPISAVEEKVFGKEWVDFQREYDGQLGFERQVSLKLALEMAGIDFAGREHDALDDARNTAELLHIFNDEVLFNTTLKKIEGIMKPTSLSASLGSMIDFSAFAVA